MLLGINGNYSICLSFPSPVSATAIDGAMIVGIVLVHACYKIRVLFIFLENYKHLRFCEGIAAVHYSSVVDRTA